MGNVLRELVLPAEKDSPYVDFIYKGLVGTDTLYLKAGWISTGIPKIYRVKYIVQVLTTSAAVANRYCSIKGMKLDGDEGFQVYYAASGAIPASTTDRLLVTQSYTGHTGGTMASGDYAGMQDMIMQGDDRLEIGVVAAEAGDLSNVIVRAVYISGFFFKLYRKLGIEPG